jgi:hypothetical protein
LQALTDILGTSGTQALTSGTNILGPALNYWQNLLQEAEHPTRQALLEQEGPVVSSIISQYNTGKAAVAQQPRGGGKAAIMANLPFQESGAITGVLETQLQQIQNVLGPEAAQQIGAIGQFIDSLGLDELGLSSGNLATLISAGLARRGQNTELLNTYLQGMGQAAGMAAAMAAGA